MLACSSLGDTALLACFKMVNTAQAQAGHASQAGHHHEVSQCRSSARSHWDATHPCNVILCLAQATTMGKPALQLPFTLGPVSPSRQVSSRQLGPVRARGLAAGVSSRRHSLASGSSRASSDRLEFNSVSEFAPTPSSLSVSRVHFAQSSQPSDTGLEHVRVRRMQLPFADHLHNAPATSLNARRCRRPHVVCTAFQSLRLCCAMLCVVAKSLVAINSLLCMSCML